MKTKYLAPVGALALALAIGGSTLVVAQQPSQPRTDDQSTDGGRRGRGNFDPAQFFGRLDANSDGSITADEFRWGDEAFKAVDADGDGKVTQTEFSASRQRFGGRGGANPDGGGFAGGFGQGGIDAIKERLGVTDEEWSVLQPRIQKAMELRAQLTVSPFRGQGGQRGGGQGGQRGGNQAGPPQSLPEADALRSTLDNASASAEDIKGKLAAYREARAKKEAELKAAREELRDLVSARQEAILVLSNVLD